MSDSYNSSPDENRHIENNIIEPRKEHEKEVDEIMSVKDWVITSLVLAIPIVNIIILFVWAFDKNGNKNRKNYCMASLILCGIFIVLYFCFIFFFFFLLGLSIFS